jgi:hypothetical protein
MCQDCQGENKKTKGGQGRPELCRSDLIFHDYLSLRIFMIISLTMYKHIRRCKI